MAEHASVEEMVNALSSESFATEFAEQNAKTQLSQALSVCTFGNALSSYRIGEEKSQRAFADRVEHLDSKSDVI